MIEIVQAGQAGKTGLLFDMHRLRSRVFKDTLKWDVAVNNEGLEVDQFDIPETIYLLALNKDRRVVGSWRLLATTGPTMIRQIWPEYLKSLPMPANNDVWEVSRFAIDSPAEDPEEKARQVQSAIGEMFCALTELCLMARIKEIYTLYDERIAKVIQRINCAPCRTSDQIPIGGVSCQVGAFRTNEEMLATLQQATGIRNSCLTGVEMPVMIQKRMAI